MSLIKDIVMTQLLVQMMIICMTYILKYHLSMIYQLTYQMSPHLVQIDCKFFPDKGFNLEKRNDNLYAESEYVI